MFKFFKIINLNIIHINVNNKLYNFINKKKKSNSMCLKSLKSRNSRNVKYYSRDNCLKLYNALNKRYIKSYLFFLYSLNYFI